MEDSKDLEPQFTRRSMFYLDFALIATPRTIQIVISANKKVQYLNSAKYIKIGQSTWVDCTFGNAVVSVVHLKDMHVLNVPILSDHLMILMTWMLGKDLSQCMLLMGLLWVQLTVHIRIVKMNFSMQEEGHFVLFLNRSMESVLDYWLQPR